MAGFDPVSDEEVAELLHQVQLFAFPRRLRLREFFVDFDPLRSGRCTLMQFSRALAMAGVQLSRREVEGLAGHFMEVGGRVQKPQDINYVNFCQAVDEVFNKGEANPRMTSSPSTTQMMASFQRDPGQDEERFMNLLHRVAMLCKTRGVVLKYCFTDHDRAAIASPSRVNPRTGGKVTKSQFIRNFPFRKEIAEPDLDLLAERYRVGGPEGTGLGDVHFMALHNDVSQAMVHEMPPFPRSDLFLKPDDTEWSHQQLHPVQKLQAKVVEKRVRLHEHFQDFDPLRKGVCTVGQVKTVFTILNIGKEIDRVEFDMVVGAYMRDDGMFCYKDFCGDIDRGFASPGLEKDPMAVTSMPDATSTAPGRRNRITMTPSRLMKCSDLEDKIRSRVRRRGIYLKPAFKDMDRAGTGHVSRNQFTRVMHMLGFELDDAAIGLLCGNYCDLGNHNDFNYVDFLRCIDPPNEDTELAMEQATAPFSDLGTSKYFDARGTVRSIDRVGSPLMA